MGDEHTTIGVQRYLDQLAQASGDATAEQIVRELIASSVNRLHVLCASLLFRCYPRLTKPLLNLQPDEMLSAVVERMLKTMRSVRPQNVRQFITLANQHMRWELSDMARRLGNQVHAQEMRDSFVGAPTESVQSTNGTLLSPDLHRILEAIESLPDDEWEAFDLVRTRGMTHPDAAAVIGCSTRTVQRRLNRSLLLLADRIGDVQLPQAAPGPP